MASPRYLKQADNGVYYVHWTEGRVGKRVSTRARGLPEAEAFLAKWLTLTTADPSDGSTVTVADCWALYDREHIQKRVVERKKAEYYWTLLEPHFGALAVSDLSQMAVDKYVTLRTKTVKPATVRNELGYLIAAINFSAEKPHKLIDKAVAADATEGLRLPAHSAPKDRWLKDDEIRALLTAARDMRVGERLSRGERFLWLALYTAARKEAILDLTWDRVDFETNTIDLNVPGRQITKKRRAVVPIAAALRPVLERAHRERQGALVMDSKAEVWATVQSIVIRAGLAPKQRIGTGQKPKATGISPHVLRHTAATHMARRGVALWKIANVLGNTLAVVEKTYAKWQPAEMRAAVDEIVKLELETEE